MNILQPEKRRLAIHSLSRLVSKPCASTVDSCLKHIVELRSSPPFVQLDVVFPSNPTLLSALERLETSYGKAKSKLSDILDNAEVFLNSEGESNLLAVGANSPEEEDVWCVDPRGHLTLSVSKSTYERLGLIGQKLPFKNHRERHVINIPLQKNVQSPVIRERQKTNLGIWDKRRESELGKEAALWEVLYCWKGEPHDAPFQGGKTQKVRCRKKELQDVHVPSPSLSPRPEISSSKSKTTKDGDDALDDWNRQVESLFEWVGMACIGAQRLQINDRIDPFVALYDPPEPSHIGSVTHLQWCGLLELSFVKQTIDTVLSAIQDTASTIPFVSITCHALTSSPVSYIPYTTTPTGGLQAPTSAPAKVPRLDSEDTWCLILARPPQEEKDAGPGTGAVRWCLAESLGQWDARWG